MAITSKMVMDLREKTGVGMMDCKRALEETQGNIEDAVKLLRKKGMATAEKRASKAAKEGQVAFFSTPDCRKGVLLELNCETDFVAKTDDFKSLLGEIGNQLLESGAKAAEEFLEESSSKDASQKVKDRITAVIGKLGENIQFRRFAKLEAGYVSSYIHAGGKIGVILGANVQEVDDKTRELCKDLCMQVAASSPRFVASKDVTQEVLDSEKEIYKEQVVAQGKPANMIDKIVEGKMGKYFEEYCLMDQSFIKDPSIKVSKHIAASTQAPFEVNGFSRFAVGEEAPSQGE